MRLINLNLNGIRSAYSKGLWEWLDKISPDCIGIQEIRASHEDLAVPHFQQCGNLIPHFNPALRKGYSGVGIYTRAQPTAVRHGFGHDEFDSEGRWIELQFDNSERKLSIVSAYFPSGSSSEERQAAKIRFLSAVSPVLQSLAQEREFILCGDINIAHKEIDLKNWKGNLKNSGFLPEERAWIDYLIDSVGLVDVFRKLYPDIAQYTWWSNRGQARKNNVGWRIDYQFATPGIAGLAHSGQVYSDHKFSDHAPLIIDYNLIL
jgi:exodeoxyribonuclease-3